MPERAGLLLLGVIAISLGIWSPPALMATPADTAVAAFGPYRVPVDPTPPLCTANGLAYTPANTVTGTAGPDFLLLGNQGQLALALGGHDIVSGANGKDCIDGGDGNDLLKGFNAKDVILGGNGSDTLFGGNGDDVLDGGPGFDICIGGEGQDTIVNCELVFNGEQPDSGGGCDGHHRDALVGGAGGGSGHGDEDDDEDECCDGDRESGSLTGGAGGGGDHGDCDEGGHRTTTTASGGSPTPSAGAKTSGGSGDPTETPSAATGTVTPGATPTPAKPTATPTKTPTATPTSTPTPKPTQPGDRPVKYEFSGVAVFSK